jgi:hypothetical protein
MYELSLTECQRRRKVLREIREDLESNPGANPDCECHAKAKAALPDLIERLIAGDDQFVEPILAFYQRCINTWAKHAYSDPVYESHFKAELAARLIQECTGIESASLCHRLKTLGCEIIDAHLKHIEEHQIGLQGETKLDGHCVQEEAALCPAND